MLGISNVEFNEAIDTAKGKYKYPITLKDFYKVRKRELKYRKNEQRKGSKAEGRK